jgi:hypothetical protein
VYLISENNNEAKRLKIKRVENINGLLPLATINMYLRLIIISPNSTAENRISTQSLGALKGSVDWVLK